MFESKTYGKLIVIKCDCGWKAISLNSEALFKAMEDHKKQHKKAA